MWACDQYTETLSGPVSDAMAAAQAFVPLCSLRASYLTHLFHYVTVCTLAAGDCLFEVGGCDLEHIYLEYGDVELQYPSGYRDVVRAGDTILPLVHQFPRPCQAVALTDISVMCIDSARLDQSVTWSQIIDYWMSELSLRRDYDDDIDWMQSLVQSNLFYKVPPVNAELIFSRLTPMVLDTGETIIHQGDMGDCCYFLKEGYVDILRRPNAECHRGTGLSSAQQKIAELGPGSCFGEDALVNKAPRNASVVIASPALLMRLGKDDFDVLLQEPAVDEINEPNLGDIAGTPIYIDVRTDDEYQLGHMAYSANIPLGLLSIKKRLLNIEQPYVFYCDTGLRSRAAAYLLGKQGYNTFALRGGFMAQNMADNLVQDEGYVLRDGQLLQGH